MGFTQSAKAVHALLLLFVGLSPTTIAAAAEPHKLTVTTRPGSGTSVFREGEKQPILVAVAKVRSRPYLHPIVAPDGNGVLTEHGPAHHKHQTYKEFAGQK